MNRIAADASYRLNLKGDDDGGGAEIASAGYRLYRRPFNN
ncbi:hypothetical protein SAMN05661091_0008 [Paenibacillus uliginis N3/975]|uniref:Uncharacterized protein n=1 Tax=Paenibacillus uliginis N3/975 TaxID=1313296 RepID=A0A1X7G4B7_9BACL|nr:hypothetical protein SAMN05661091_0008 [Paenibacillus uliginis N3/975]